MDKTARLLSLLAFIALIALIALTSCSGGPGPGLGPSRITGRLPTVSQPPWPDFVPGYTELDPSTGLHMTGTPQLIELAGYRLSVVGAVDNPLYLTYDELRRLPRLSAKPALICRGYFEDYANWAGASLSAILGTAGIMAGAAEVELISADGYSTSLQLAEALDPGAFLAYELEGAPLPVLHGFPVRAVFPSQLGSKWAKWVVEIRVR
jgi:DMSO/TMAO reductase YedYZ molybdopterin-dependent catalytic subunit